jgi:sec-independent protein translocase protein TatA
MGGNLSGWHGLILLLVVLLLFAAPKLPGLARSLAQSITIFRGEVRKTDEESEDSGASTGDSTSRSGS